MIGHCPRSMSESKEGLSAKTSNNQGLFPGGPWRCALLSPFLNYKLCPLLLCLPLCLRHIQNLITTSAESRLRKMMIFDWVHRRFRQDSSSSSISLYEEKPRASVKSESKYFCDKEALLVPNNLDVDTIDNWKLDDILTIGTLAISPLETLGKLDELDIMDVDCVEKNVISEYFAFGDGDYNDTAPPQGNKTLELGSMLEDNFDSPKLFQQDSRSELKCKEIELVYDFTVFAAEEEDFKKDQKDGERITLAELFMAEHDPVYLEEDDDLEDAKLIPSKKEKSVAKNGRSKAKKQDMHLLKKFKKFMKRIVKKKVHPELMGKTDEKGDTGAKKQQYAANNESAPLLHVNA